MVLLGGWQQPRGVGGGRVPHQVRVDGALAPPDGAAGRRSRRRGAPRARECAALEEGAATQAILATFSNCQFIAGSISASFQITLILRSQKKQSTVNVFNRISSMC